jgi:hypothetical protein
MFFLNRFIFALVAVICMNACYDASSYQGDGVLEDRGPFDAKVRYVLTLGEIEIGKPGRFEFELFGLPSEEFVVGLEMDLSKVGLEGSLSEQLPCDPSVYIKIMRAHEDEVLLDVGGYIASEWTWSVAIGDQSAFVYARENGGVHFNVESPRCRYNLIVTVDGEARGSCTFNTILMAKSSGWK